MLVLATVEDMLIDHVDFSQAFLQGDMLEEKAFEGDVYISPPPGYGEDAKCVYCGDRDFSSWSTVGVCFQCEGFVWARGVSPHF